MNPSQQATHAPDATDGRAARDWRSVVATSAVAVAFGLLGSSGTSEAAGSTGDNSIRPFKVQVPQAQIDDLRRRIAATRFRSARPSTTSRRACSSRS